MSSSRSFRAWLLAGVSITSLLWNNAPARALPFSAAIGGQASAAAASAAAAAAAGSAQAQIVTQRSMTTLLRAAQAVQAMQQVQSAARNLALSAPGNVPNGLAAGGLVPDSLLASPGIANPVTTWVGANTPTQSTSNGQTNVTINQTAPQALLNWQSFNVGAQTTVNFNQQGNTNWVALNQIAASGVPSQILGSIRASGAVYLINPNGIVFRGSSQINVNTLIASSLDITNLANFLNGSGILTNGTATSFQSADASNNPYTAGAVTVQAGAEINASGGQVLLLAPSVENDGAISTPAGQTLLLGGSDVMLSTGTSTLRGFVVSLNSNTINPNLPIDLSNSALSNNYLSSTTPGTVVNDGSISAPQGNITMVAGQITQNGVLTSTTSTTQNGSVILRAETGNLLLSGLNDNPLYAAYGVAAQPSLIQIIPDATDQSMVTDTQAIANSSISLTGTNVDIRGIVQLQGYDVTNQNDAPGGISITATGTNQTTIGQVFLEDGSILDASGTTDAAASASRNSVAVELRASELADLPVVEAGPLYQQTIFVDASALGVNAGGTTWEGTPLADASAWIALTTRSLDERLDNGAPITIGGAIIPQSGGQQTPVNVVQAPGSIINISGGYLTYTPGFVQVSELVTANGELVSATDADPNVDYSGICCSFTVDHSHWGVSETYTTPLLNSESGYFQDGYIEGGAGGSLTLDVSSAVLEGKIYATTIQGEKQLTGTSAPTAAALNIDSINYPVVLNLIFGTAYQADDMILSDAAAATAAQWTANFTTDTDLNALFAANAAAPNSVYMPSSWLNSGVGSISLAANNDILLPAGNPISLPAGSSFSASANSVDIESSITAPGGTITLTGAYTTSSSYVTDLNSNLSATSGLVTIGAGVTLSAAGAWTNNTDGATAAIAANGGTIAVNSYGNIDLGQGSVLDVSGGGDEAVVGKISAGKGGSLTLAAGLALPPSPDLPTGMPVPPVAPLGFITFGGGTLAAGQLEGYGVNDGAGGSLTFTSYDVVTITTSAQTGGALMASLPTATDDAGNAYSPLAVSTDFFSSGGFSNISLKAAGITLPADVTLAPTVELLAISNSTAASQSSLAGIATPMLAAQGIRPSASIALDAVGDLWNRGVIGAAPSADYQTSVDPTTYGLDIAGTIQTDPKGSVSLTGNQIAIVSGTVNAPDGTITLNGGTYSYTPTVTPTALNGEGVWLTATGQLLARGTQIVQPQSNGLPYDDVLPGGQVSVSGGDIILAPGSLIDVSGTSGISSLEPAGSVSTRALFGSAGLLGTSPVSSAAGTIAISAVIGGVLEGNLLGESGGGDAAGGTLSLFAGWARRRIRMVPMATGRRLRTPTSRFSRRFSRATVIM